MRDHFFPHGAFTSRQQEKEKEDEETARRILAWVRCCERGHCIEWSICQKQRSEKSPDGESGN